MKASVDARVKRPTDMKVYSKKTLLGAVIILTILCNIYFLMRVNFSRTLRDEESLEKDHLLTKIAVKLVTEQVSSKSSLKDSSGQDYIIRSKKEPNWFSLIDKQLYAYAAYLDHRYANPTVVIVVVAKGKKKDCDCTLWRVDAQNVTRLSTVCATIRKTPGIT